MRSPRGAAATFCVSLLVLSGLLLWPADVPAHDLARKPSGDSQAAGAGDGAPSGHGTGSGGSIGATDVLPGETARTALSRIVADPGAVLNAYAPLAHQSGAAGRTPATEPQGASAPSEPNGPAVLRASLGSPGATPAPNAGQVPGAAEASPAGSVLPASDPATHDTHAAVDPASPAAAAPAVVAPPTPPAQSAPATGGASPTAGPSVQGPDPAPASGSLRPVEPAATDKGAELGSSGESASKPLEPAALQNALVAFVGAEPAHASGAATAEARYKDRQAISAVYAARGYAPFWIENGKFNAKGVAALSRIDHAAEDGLDLRAFPVAVPAADNADALAASELALTDAVVTYGKQASGGRVDPSRLGPLVGAKPEVAEPAQILASLEKAQDAGDALRAFNPQQKGYALLRDKLAELRQNSNVAGRDPIPYGRVLKPGMRDARVPLIRARFGLDLPSAEAERTGLVYDTQVAAAVAGFQRSHHLPASGVLTMRTVAALSGGNPRRLEDEIIANMERWRWLPRDMGESHIEVNIPDYSLNVMHDDTVVHHARVVVGQPDKPTPIFSDTMRFIIVNPYWNVPLSIVKKEMMPKLAADPNYFENHGYEVVERNGVTYVRQPPGDSNALGRIKFMFPNKYSVYLHDTNARSLFGSARRALSHGCVRVEQPFKLAEVVLGRENGWTEARVKRMVGGNERTINLPHPLPLHIVYFTAFVDQNGALQLRDDVYGYSAKLKSALGLEG